MFIKHVFSEYLNQTGEAKVNDILWIPFTRIGIHALELDREVLLEKGNIFIKKIENNVRYLKSIKIDGALGHGYATKEQAPENLYQLIQAWNLNALMGFNRGMNFLEFQFLQDIDDEYFYSVLYYDVMNGRVEKRNLRLHFSDTVFPLTMNCPDGTTRCVALQLTSMSEYGMLFQVSGSYLGMIEMAKSCDLTIDLTGIFECWSGQAKELFKGLRQREHSLDAKSNHKPVTLSVNKEKISFSQNRLEKLRCGGSIDENQNYYMCIPFEALEDNVLFDESDIGKMFRQELEHFRTDLNAAILSD